MSRVETLWMPPGTDGPVTRKTAPHAPTSAPGLGRALLLDGVDDYVSIAPQLLNDLAQGSVEANLWVESFIPNVASPIIAKGDVTLTQFLLGISSNSIVVAGAFGLDGLTAPASIPLRRWTKVAVTWDGSVRKLYVNDLLVGQDASPFFPPNDDGNPVKIGRHDHIGGPFYFHGRIEDVRISGIARSFP